MIDSHELARRIEATNRAMDDLKRRVHAIENAGVIRASNQMDAHSRQINGALKSAVGERHA